MKLKDLHKDMSRYLEEDCYCSGEIYSSDGFFFQVYEDDDEVVSLGQGKNDRFGNVLGCIVPKTKQVIVFLVDETNEKVLEATRFDATENNVDNVKGFINNTYHEQRNFDMFKDNTTEEDIKKVLSMSNGLIIGD